VASTRKKGAFGGRSRRPCKSKQFIGYHLARTREPRGMAVEGGGSLGYKNGANKERGAFRGSLKKHRVRESIIEKAK